MPTKVKERSLADAPVVGEVFTRHPMSLTQLKQSFMPNGFLRQRTDLMVYDLQQTEHYKIVFTKRKYNDLIFTGLFGLLTAVIILLAVWSNGLQTGNNVVFTLKTQCMIQIASAIALFFAYLTSKFPKVTLRSYDWMLTSTGSILGHCWLCDGLRSIYGMEVSVYTVSVVHVCDWCNSSGIEPPILEPI